MNRPFAPYVLLGSTLIATIGTPALADQDDGDLLVISRIQYVTDTTPRPESFPLIFTDPNVSGVQGNIFLDYLRPFPGAHPLSVSLTAAAAAQHQPPITTSFSSKSEGALTLSVDGRFLTYMGYNAVAGLEGVSNSETTNPAAQITGATGPFYDRAIAMIDAHGNVTVTPENFAYSGDNPRAVVTVDGTQFYMAGNADSTENKTSPVTGPGLTIGARLGAPGSPLSIQLGTYVAVDRPDESTKQHVKDNNFRGIGIFRDANGVPNLYVSKGSGGNGDDGIFQVEAGTADGLPVGTTNTIIQLIGTQATNPGTGASSPLTPFGFFFANPTTLYVADEGNATIGTDAQGNPILVSDPLAGLQKWSLVNKVWQLEYVLQDGLDLNVKQNVPGYPVPTYTTGLRNLTGRVNNDGTVTIYAVTAQTSSISGGEPDPTKLVAVTDDLDATHLPTDDDHFRFDDGHGLEHFVTLQQARAGEVFRGVAFAPKH
ncbi:MAG TPA: hypothetical protein VGR70_22485 [Stellaceae bacterium]|nr:hypothetical protein [Stellaceae bacterium]